MPESKYADYFDELYEAVEEVFEEEDDERRRALVDEVYKKHPDNPFAKYLKWQESGDDESKQADDMLAEAVDSLRPLVAEEVASGQMDDEILSVYVSILSDLAALRYFDGDKDAALAVAREFMELDRDCYVIGRLIFYSLLIEREEYDEAVSAADDDVCETPVAAYARAIGLYENEGPTDEASDALLEAISLDPDMPFYILGMWELPEDDDEVTFEELAYLEDLTMHVAMLSDLWGVSEERLAFLGVVAFAFGYITGRIDDAGDLEMMEDGYKTLGCLDEMREARDTAHAAIASGKDQNIVDEEALLAFREIRDKGFFS